jgi:hypothetical protein
MLAQAVSLEVEFSLEDNKLLFQALPVIAHEVVSLEVLLEGIVVHIVVWLPRVTTVADEAAFVFVSAVLVELVIIIETSTAEAAEWMSTEACLVGSARLIIATPHMLRQLPISEHIMLVCEDLFVASAQVAHLLVVDGTNMPVEVLPTEAGKVAIWIRAVVAQEEDCVPNDILASIANADIIVGACNVGVGILLVALIRVVRKNDKRCICLD